MPAMMDLRVAQGKRKMRAKLRKAIDLALSALDTRRTVGLLAFGFHGLWPDWPAPQDQADPYQPVTPDDLDQLISGLLTGGYRFVTARDLDGVLPRRAVWLTFDDGYANNLGLLPILRRYGVPATVFVTSGNILSGEAFWWDVLYRESRRRSVPMAEAAVRREALKALPPDAIRARLLADFGADAFCAQGEMDRPMTPSELANFAADPLIEIGNHTRSHAILPILDATGQRAEITAAQQDLARLTGRLPTAIAYPNGGATAETLRIASAAGLQNGVTCLPHATTACQIADPTGRLAIGRFLSLRHGAMPRETRLAMAHASIGQYQAAATCRALLSGLTQSDQPPEPK